MSAVLVQWLTFALAIPTVIGALASLSKRNENSSAASWIVTIAIVGTVIYETGIAGQGIYPQLTILVLCFAIAFVAILIVKEKWRESLSIVLLLPAIVSLVFFLSNAIENPAASAIEQIVRLAPVVFWLAYGMLLSVSRITVDVVTSATNLALAFSALLAPMVTSPSRPCDDFKCGIFGYIYTGPFVSENFLAKIASVAIILNLLAKGRRILIAPLALAVLLLAVSTSRTAVLALGVALIVGAASRAVSSRLATGVIWSIAVLAGLASWLLVTTSPLTAFSNRGGIWARTISAIGDSYWLGLGIDRWAYLQSIGVLPLNFPHNQLLLAVFAGGLIAAALTIVMFATTASVASRTRETRPAGVALVTYLFVGGLTEVMWNPSTVDGHVFVVSALVAAAAASRAAEPERALRLSTGIARGGRSYAR